MNYDGFNGTINVKKLETGAMRHQALAKGIRHMVDPNPDLKNVLAELRDISKEKRRTAVMKLGMMGGDEALRTLIFTVENQNEDLLVRGRAALMLGKLGDSRAVGPLIRALDAPGYQTPINAVTALGLIGDSRAVDPLLNVARTSKDKLHSAAVDALRRLGITYETDDIDIPAQPEPEM